MSQAKLINSPPQSLLTVQGVNFQQHAPCDGIPTFVTGIIQVFCCEVKTSVQNNITYKNRLILLKTRRHAAS